MLEEITWWQFFMFMAIALALYYGFVYIKFYLPANTFKNSTLSKETEQKNEDISTSSSIHNDIFGKKNTPNENYSIFVENINNKGVYQNSDTEITNDPEPIIEEETEYETIDNDIDQELALEYEKIAELAEVDEAILAEIEANAPIIQYPKPVSIQEQEDINRGEEEVTENVDDDINMFFKQMEDLKNKYDVPNINESKKDRNIKLSDFDFGDELNFSQN